jgi:hypothetical protein
MRAWQIGVASAIWLAAMPCHAEPELPVWHGSGPPDGSVVGGLLGADSPRGDDERMEGEAPTAEEIAAPENPEHGIPEKYWSLYFGARPKEFLVDPQGLLRTSEFKDRLDFLNYHAGDSTIDLFVYVFKGDQEIPGEVREEELVERFFATGRPAAIVYFFLGAPRRSVLYLSPTLTDTVPATEQHRALEDSVMQAVGKSDSSGQLEAFIVQMSIRIYLMERERGGAVAAGAARDKPAKAGDKKAALMAKLQPVLEKARRFVAPAAGLAGMLVMAVVLRLWMLRRARYQFPERVVEPRLGGTHAAGIGAVISFASAATSLASQREQVPDDPQRR